MSEGEARATELGIPTAAETVVLFVESSHWDPNWLYTSRGYYRRFVRKNLDLVVDELEAEPQRVYCIECTFFLEMYLRDRPEQRERIAQLFAERRLRMLSASVTTPDTLLPRTESILRDFERGGAFLSTLAVEPPTTAYLPDDFGHSPIVADVAAGLRR